MDNGAEANSYRFGRFILDPVERRLRANGMPVPLGTTAFNVLLALVEGAGADITKDELISRVWGNAQVGDNRLQVHINALRKTLGKDCIVTRHRRGYAFVAQIERVSPRTRSSCDDQIAGNLSPHWATVRGPARLIGRQAQIREISELLSFGRLVTLTGPPGVGKTRLALHCASENSNQFPDGVWLVELASLKDPNLTPGAVAGALGTNIGDKAVPVDALARHLARKTLLLVLDNCEHLIVAVARLCDALLAATAGVKILATSREALACFGQQAFDVPPLETPHERALPPGVARAMPAIELFAERAKGANCHFQMDDEDIPIAAQICRRLDGLPLAIEMVAGWAGVLGLEALNEELNGSMQAWMRAKNSAPPRHASLYAALEWSHNLLTQPEGIVLRRLATFAGSFTLDAAKAVVVDDAIGQEHVFEYVGSLIRKSMIAVGPETKRYRLLETTRVFALERLKASGEAELFRHRHANYVFRSLESAVDEWETSSDAVWLGRYGSLVDDLRNALDWAMEADSDDAIRLAGVSWPLWREMSLFVEGAQRLKAATSRLSSSTPPMQEARLRRGLGDMQLNTGGMKAAHAEFARAAVLYRGLGEPAFLGSALAGLATTSLTLGRVAEAEQAITESLELLEQTASPRTLATAYSMKLCIASSLGRFDVACAAGEKAARLCQIVGADRLAFVVAANLVEATLDYGDIDLAISTGRALEQQLRETVYLSLRGFVLGILSGALTLRGDLDEALIAAREASPLLRDYDMLFWLFDHLALRAALAGHAKDAARIAGYADSVHRKLAQAREPIGLRAIERLTPILQCALSSEEIAQLKLEGMLLTEDQATTLALLG